MSRENPCLRHGCSACCHDTEMPLTERDAARLEALGHARADFSLVDAADGTLRLRTLDADGPRPCFFLRDGRCSVYDARPEGCRIYPFVLDEGDIVVKDEECPHRDEFHPGPEVGRELLRIVSVIEGDALERLRRRRSDIGGGP